MIACLLVPSLGIACELASRPALRGQPVALSDDAGLRVLDASPEAAARGVRPGMSLREAAALCPALAVVAPRPARLARVLHRLRAALEAVSPLVETPSLEQAMAGDTALYADLRGTEALYPRPEDAARALLSALPLSTYVERAGALPKEGQPGEVLPGEGPRLGLASSRFTALAAARSAPPLSRSAGEGQAEGRGEGWRHVPQAEAAAFLAPLPADWLPLPVEALDHLRLLGIRTLGALAALPGHAVQAQLGPEGALAWLAARGEDPAPIRPDPAPGERILERAHAEPPLVGRESILAAAEQLLGRALRHPRARRRFVRTLRLRAVTEDDRLWEHAHTMKEPTGDRTRLWTAVRTHLERAEYPGAVAELELELGGLTAESGRQPSLLFADRARRREQLDEMVRHLKARYGCSPVARVVALEPWSRLPERRHALLEYDP